MRLKAQLTQLAESDDSYFRRHLAREDLARLDKLSALKETAADLEQFLKEGLYIGWTQNDMRTHELKDTLVPFLTVLFIWYENETPENEEAVSETWSAFEADRLKKLVHCL